MLIIFSLTLGGSVISAETFPKNEPLRVAITTHLGDEQHFREDDEISLLVSLNRDAFLLLVYQDASGSLVKLFPVRKNDNGWMKAGDFMPFPRRIDGLRLVVSPPFGEEQVWAFIAAEAFPAKPLQGNDDINALRNQLQRHDTLLHEARTLLTTRASEH